MGRIILLIIVGIAVLSLIGLPQYSFAANAGWQPAVEDLQQQLDDLINGVISIVVNWGDIVGVPPDIADGDDDTLMGLGCSTNQIAKYDGSQWICSNDETGSVGDLTAIEEIVFNFDHDNDGFTVNDGDCDDIEPTTNPSAPEIFDGIDNNCDNVIDDINIIITLDDTTNSGRYTSITIGNDGLPIISYDSGNFDNLKVAHCSDVVCSTATFNIVDNLATISKTSIAIGNDGLPIISYNDRINRELKVAHCADAVCSASTITTVRSDPTFFSSYDSHSLAIGSDGLPIISFQERTASGDAVLKTVHCSDLACLASTINTVDPILDTGHGNSITIGSDGFPIISYSNDNNLVSGLNVAHCSDVVCSAATIHTIDPTSDNSLTSITIGMDNLPIISYYNDNPENYNVAHCSHLVCSSATLTNFDTVGDQGFNSIAIGSDGLPIISYYDNNNGYLKVAHCSDFSCSTPALTILDSGGVGRYNSLVIGNDGLPIISYLDIVNQALNTAHCLDVTCQ